MDGDDEKSREKIRRQVDIRHTFVYVLNG